MLIYLNNIKKINFHSEKKSYRLSFLVEHIRTVEFFSVSRKKSILLRQRTTLE